MAVVADPEEAAPREPVGGAPDQASTDVELSASFRRTVRTLGSVVAPTSLVTALLYYFGWARTSSQAATMGLDDSILGFSTQDYILRSISSMFLPLVVGLVAVLLWARAHAEICEQLATRTRVRRLRRLTVAIGVAGAALTAFGLFVVIVEPSYVADVMAPLSFVVGLGALGYAGYLRGRLARRPRRALAGSADLRWLPSLNAGVAFVLLALALFWAVADYADAVGRDYAEYIEAHVTDRPGVVVYSQKRLQLAQPAVTETEITGEESAYRFRYAGLRLLFRANGKFFLIPESYTLADAVTIVLPDTDDLRLEFGPGAR